MTFYVNEGEEFMNTSLESNDLLTRLLGWARVQQSSWVGPSDHGRPEFAALSRSNIAGHPPPWAPRVPRPRKIPGQLGRMEPRLCPISLVHPQGLWAHVAELDRQLWAARDMHQFIGLSYEGDEINGLDSFMARIEFGIWISSSIVSYRYRRAPPWNLSP